MKHTLEENLIRSNNENGLPLPRFEFLWEKVGDTWSKSFCNYYLCLPLGKYDIRAEGSSDGERAFGEYCEQKILIGRTEVNSYSDDTPPPVNQGNVRTPFRDHAHMLYDNMALGGHIPMFAVCGSNVTRIQNTLESNND